MIGQVFKGRDTAGKPILEWVCTCSKCRTCTSSCLALLQMYVPNFKETHTIRIEPTLFYPEPYNLTKGKSIWIK